MQQGAAVDRDLQDLAGRFLDFVHRATKLPMIVCDELSPRAGARP